MGVQRTLLGDKRPRSAPGSQTATFEPSALPKGSRHDASETWLKETPKPCDDLATKYSAPSNRMPAGLGTAGVPQHNSLATNQATSKVEAQQRQYRPDMKKAGSAKPPCAGFSGELLKPHAGRRRHGVVPRNLRERSPITPRLPARRPVGVHDPATWTVIPSMSGK